MSEYWRAMLSAKVSVVMPAYNEADHIIANLHETLETFARFAQDFEVIVVDDGSPDRTWLAATKLPERWQPIVRILRYDRNLGKGNALMCGAHYAAGEFIVFLDSDMDLHPQQVPSFFDVMSASNADIVIGSKWHPGSDIDYPPMRRLLSLGYYRMVRMMFGLPVRDTQTGLKLFKAGVLKAVLPKLLAKRFAFDLELLSVAHHLGFKIVEAPVSLRYRRTLPRLRLRDITKVLQDTLAIFYRLRLLRYYDRPVVVPPPVAEGVTEVQADPALR